MPVASRWCLVALLVLSPRLPSGAQDTSATGEHPAIGREGERSRSHPSRTCFRGAPGSKCESFLLLEFSAPRFVAGSKLDPAVTGRGVGFDRSDQALASQFLLDIGLMHNVREREAVGATVTFGFIDPHPDEVIGVTGRYRRWLADWASADAAIGIVSMPVGIEVQGPQGLARGSVRRPALSGELRLGVLDLLAVEGRAMVASNGRGRNHSALFLGVSSGSWVTAAIGASTVGMYLFYAVIAGSS